MTRWEYHLENGRYNLTAEQLTGLGRERWELVAVVPREGGRLAYYFKRPVTS